MATSIFFLDLAITVIFTAIAGVVVQSVAHRRNRRGAAAGRQRAARPLAVRADPALPRGPRVLRKLPAPPHPASPAHGAAASALWPSWCRRSGCRSPGGSIRPSCLLARPTIADFVSDLHRADRLLFHLHLFRRQRLPRRLCDFIFRRYGRNLSLFFGSYTLKLVAAALAISVVPLAAIVVDLFSYDVPRLQRRDPGGCCPAILGVAISAFFIGRSLLRPFGTLSRAMTEVAGGQARRPGAGHLQRRGRASSPAGSTTWSRACASANRSARRSAAMSTKAWPRPSCAARARAPWPARPARRPSCSPTSRASPPSPSTGAARAGRRR